MSAQAVLQAAFVAAIEAHAPLTDALTGIFDAPPMRAARPHALVEEAVLTDWGTKDMAGREARITVALRDQGERPERLRTLASAVEEAVAAMPPALGEGWRVASLVLLRSRLVREGEGRWTALIEFRVRVLREEA